MPSNGSAWPSKAKASQRRGSARLSTASAPLSNDARSTAAAQCEGKALRGPAQQRRGIARPSLAQRRRCPAPLSVALRCPVKAKHRTAWPSKGNARSFVAQQRLGAELRLMAARSKGSGAARRSNAQQTAKRVKALLWQGTAYQREGVAEHSAAPRRQSAARFGIATHCASQGIARPSLAQQRRSGADARQRQGRASRGLATQGEGVAGNGLAQLRHRIATTGIAKATHCEDRRAATARQSHAQRRHRTAGSRTAKHDAASQRPSAAKQRKGGATQVSAVPSSAKAWRSGARRRAAKQGARHRETWHSTAKAARSNANHRAALATKL